MNRTEIESTLVEKAAADGAFREQLKQNPRAAIKAALALEIPKTVEITVFEETPQRLCLVLPARIKAGLQEGELEDAELEGVAGGQSGAEPKDSGRIRLRNRV